MELSDLQLPTTVSQIKRLGERLAAGELTEVDEERLRDVLDFYDSLRERVSFELKRHGIANTGRLKNRETIAEKIRRDRSRMNKIRDIAGCRVLVDGGLIQQRERVRTIRRVLGGGQVIDRIADPMRGYRAIHVELETEHGAYVEIQVRTRRQHQWAEVNEKWGDVLGRWIRYGEEAPPGYPPTWQPFASSVNVLMATLSTMIGQVEEDERGIDTTQAAVDDPDFTDLSESDRAEIRTMIEEQRRGIDKRDKEIEQLVRELEQAADSVPPVTGD